MTSDVALKLRVTAAALGCNSGKDLCARFRAANPATYFELERSQKWLQGRALPRANRIYDDWAKVLGTAHPGSWLASCPLDAFLAEVSALTRTPAAALVERAGVARVEAAPAAEWTRGIHAYLIGTFACYSLAWSPYFKGQLIRGSMRISVERRGSVLAATYSEALLHGTIRFASAVQFAGRTLHLDFRQPGGATPLFMTLFLPGAPASVLCGVMSGAIIIGPEPRPSATRIAIVRVPRDADASNGYLAPTQSAIADNLLATGIPLDDPTVAATLLRRFLFGRSRRGLDQVTAGEQVRLANLLNRVYL